MSEQAQSYQHILDASELAFLGEDFVPIPPDPDNLDDGIISGSLRARRGYDPASADFVQVMEAYVWLREGAADTPAERHSLIVDWDSGCGYEFDVDRREFLFDEDDTTETRRKAAHKLMQGIVAIME